MGTTIKSQVSKKNKYWVEKHRYYELKHFCLQYPIWKQAYTALDGYNNKSNSIPTQHCSDITDPISKCVEARLYYRERIDIVADTAKETDEFLASYIIKAVTEGVSYDFLKTRLNIPCCRDVYYDLYRRFFWLLNRAKY